jgi:acetyl-CoA carboxylase biotin carboxyl carrier protein
MNAPTEPDVPEAVTYREVQEILRTFRDSGWTGMTVHLHGMRITVGKDGPPRGAGAGVADAPPAAPPPAVAPAPGAPAAAPAAVPPGPPPTSGAATPTGGDAPVDLSGCVDVHSPAVGAFWVAPSPGQPPFVEVGQTVAQDEQLAIVEVMKLMNPVVAPVAGTVVQVCAANADLVEYEQVLFRIRPSDG